MKNHRLSNTKDRLQPESIKRELGPSLFVRNIIYAEAVNSTNTLAKALAARGAPEGTLVLAEAQTGGRGRMGRAWFSPAGTNLLFSILLRPAFNPESVFMLTMILALATIDAIQSGCGLSSMIKWPNDLYVGNKKLAGILTEFSVEGKSIEYVVLGLGLNVNWSPDEGEKITHPATSIFRETGTQRDRSDLLVQILRCFEAYYRDGASGKIDPFYERWNDLCLILGKEVVIESKEKIHGKAVRIDRDGALIIEDSQGKEQKIISGDVSLRML
jgi:BirA family biotin operon repressor/biotin-[acetyl-CoA-carboxylase] ligase